MAAKPKIRIQLLLEESQKEFLEGAAYNEGISLSALIRKIIDQYQQAITHSQLAKAAEDLYPEYLSEEEISAFRSLDQEDLFETGRSVEDNS